MRQLKILAIIGTPTGAAGYTTKTVQALEASLRDKADIVMDYVFLGDLQLGGCQGHLTCIKQGESRCPFSKDVAALTQRMQAADAVVFASPVHCFNVSTLLKNMIDLYVYQMHRPTFFGKKAVVVTAAAGAGQKGVLTYMRKTFATWGFHVIGRLGTHAGLFNENKYQPKLKRATDQVATRLINAVRRDIQPQPGVAELINFRVWRSVIKRSKDASPYDWDHWQREGWLEQDYYFPVQANPLSLALAACIERMIDRAIRNVSVKPLS